MNTGPCFYLHDGCFMNVMIGVLPIVVGAGNPVRILQQPLAECSKFQIKINKLKFPRPVKQNGTQRHKSWLESICMTKGKHISAFV